MDARAAPSISTNISIPRGCSSTSAEWKPSSTSSRRILGDRIFQAASTARETGKKKGIGNA